MILIMGASGNIGGELVKQLSARKAEFKAAYRSTVQAADAKKGGAEAVILDYASPPTLDAAFKGIDKLFVVSPPVPNLAELETNVLTAALKAGVKHFVKLSVWGAEGEEHAFARPHRAVETRVQKSGIPYTFLRPNGFMQNMIANAPTIKATGAFYLPAGDARVSEIDVRDIARVAAAVLLDEGYENKAFELSGPEALSNRDRATILSEVLGRTIRYVSPTDSEWKETMVGYGLPQSLVDGMIDLQHYYKRGKASSVLPTVKEITGDKPIAYPKFVEDYIEAFR